MKRRKHAKPGNASLSSVHIMSTLFSRAPLISFFLGAKKKKNDWRVAPRHSAGHCWPAHPESSSASNSEEMHRK